MKAYPLDADRTPNTLEFLRNGQLVAAYDKREYPQHYDVLDVQYGTSIGQSPLFRRHTLFCIQDLLDTGPDGEPRSYTLECAEGGKICWRWLVTLKGLHHLDGPALVGALKCIRTPFGYWVSFLCEDGNRRYLRGSVDGNAIVRLEDVPFPYDFTHHPNTFLFGSDPNTYLVAWFTSERMSTIHHNDEYKPIRRQDGSLFRRWPFAIATGPTQTIVLARQKAETPADEILFVENTTGNVLNILNIGPVAAVALSPDNLTAAFAQKGQVVTLDMDW